MLFLLHLGLEGITEIEADLKGRFVSLVPLQGIALENSWLGGTFLKEYKFICKIKMREMKTN